MERLVVALLFLLMSATAVRASSTILDQNRVRTLYNEGDFDGVIEIIGRFRNGNTVYSRDDSIFIAKHLAVVHAANPESVGQGKYWMNELLKLMPAADLVGMYVSVEIDRIFEKVREEFLSRQRSFGIELAGVLPNRPESLPVARKDSASDGSAKARPTAVQAVAPTAVQAVTPTAVQAVAPTVAHVVAPPAGKDQARQEVSRKPKLGSKVMLWSGIGLAGAIGAGYLFSSLREEDPKTTRYVAR